MQSVIFNYVITGAYVKQVFQTNWKQEIDITYRQMSLIFDTVFFKQKITRNKE